MIEPEKLQPGQVIRFKDVGGGWRYGVVVQNSDVFKEVKVRSRDDDFRLTWRDSFTWEKSEHVGHWSKVSKEIADKCFSPEGLKRRLDESRRRMKERKNS